MSTRRFTRGTLLLLAVISLSTNFAFADTMGSVFVTGHDPDFHAFLGGNALGARHIIQDALTFTRNGNTNPILLIESNLNNNALGDHTDSEQGLIASGYTAGATPGNHYVKVNAATFSTLALATLISTYSSIFVPSDHGGSLNEADLAALDARSADILAYVNAGGGLFAMAEDGNHSGGHAAALFGFLPFLATSAPLGEVEGGNTLTAFGSSLGLVNSDINGNFSHNIFTSTGGMNVVDRDASGEILSLAFRGQLTSSGAVPEPSSIVLLVTVVGLVGRKAYRRRSAGA